ncbi:MULTISPECIES: DinB family protein [unclassified Streptomyces]|uniref:DinB family protein n=1 Tax=unclassified Streptomyces TaxID=2593676 RepID=UPI002DD8CB3A|nr:DinB family protein [Streptomyces sp. NBC_01257]WRZ65254.1 DinB family protein [Streptomyces sp. NBC_01257]WSU59254.1 DinB family protein [Streptomyces sp. NBC_01104]
MTGTDAGTEHRAAHGTAHGAEHKQDLRLYLQDARDVFLWKLEGLSEYDIRRPLTPTGTNLLGLVKHVTGAEGFYFGGVFGRPVDAPELWIAGDAEPDADLWATADETRDGIVAQYRRVWAHSDETIEALDLDTTGRLPGGEGREITLHRALVHMVAETQRHAGHADVVRELIDGATGQREKGRNMAPGDAARWADHRARVERAAREAAAG